jgi:hypothetical protein
VSRVQFYNLVDSYLDLNLFSDVAVGSSLAFRLLKSYKRHYCANVCTYTSLGGPWKGIDNVKQNVPLFVISQDPLSLYLANALFVVLAFLALQ